MAVLTNDPPPDDTPPAAATDPPQDPQEQLQQREIARLIRLLEVPERREQALRSLAAHGAAAAAALDRAIETERNRGRKELANVLHEVRRRLGRFSLVKALGWPVDEPVDVIADYSENRLLALDGSGTVIWKLEDFRGAWDVSRPRRARS